MGKSVLTLKEEMLANKKNITEEIKILRGHIELLEEQYANALNDELEKVLVYIEQNPECTIAEIITNVKTSLSDTQLKVFLTASKRRLVRIATKQGKKLISYEKTIIRRFIEVNEAGEQIGRTKERKENRACFRIS